MKAEQDVLAFLGAAYSLIGRAYVRLSSRGGRLQVSLKSKSGQGSAALQRAFAREYEAQKGLWALARENQGLRAELAARAAVAAQTPPPAQAPGRRLSAQEAADMRALLAEEGGAAPDPLGIRVPWSELRKGGR